MELYRWDRHFCLLWPKTQYRKPRRCLAFEMVLLIWVFHERLLLMVTPSKLTVWPSSMMLEQPYAGL